MGIGVSIFLLALGAILTFALSADTVDIVNIDAVGIILMVAGLIGLALALYATNRSSAPARPVEDRPAPRDRDVY
jgi:uncharacterized membrane protein